jgi:hypothetical protein
MDLKDIELLETEISDTKELVHSKSMVSHQNITLVQVYFVAKDDAFLYLCEDIILHEGDHVYVSGKMKDTLGIVVDVRHQFKVRPSKYERVIAKIDTQLQGEFKIFNRLLLSFDRKSLGKEKISQWFFSPQGEEPYISTYRPAPFPLDDLTQFPIEHARLERGLQYYKEQRVVYMCIDDRYGYAIVRGSEHYEVEFEYNNGIIEDISCNCYCDGHCKHEFAVLLELQYMLQIVEKEFKNEYSKNGYVATIDKDIVWQMSVRWTNKGTIIFHNQIEPIIVN